jgi:hypothetical protein
MIDLMVRQDADPIRVADTFFWFLCSVDGLPKEIESVDGVDPVRS